MNIETTLTAWFKANQKYSEAHTLTYGNFFYCWVYNKWHKEWKPKKKGHTIGQMYFVHPKAGEHYYLRMLLTVVYGAISFEDLHMINNVHYPTFKDVCKALEASQLQLGSQMHYLFATILMFCYPTNPELLWQKYIIAFSDDIMFQARIDAKKNHTICISNDNIYNIALHQLEHILVQNGTSLKNFPNMPIPASLPEDLLRHN
ncbi:14064_t:CDS:2 [Cetraspora pellucida]|uniref:14064_t:CDS:1 n=1 Tax=Cetraspora pellucida TaxID=1433469 RepID=A0A9N9BZT9_9GLOM|nr:14064_t:CDS:2 [Cetraspora pellucida]